MEETDISSSVYAAVYSGVQVYEMICRGIAVMRRHSDSWLNATQILKVAGVEKGRRTKILEREILTGEHEKIQGGYGKYQGTWVPFARGVQLCNQYNVYSHIRPILEHDPTASGTRPDKTPTKAEVRKLMKSTQKTTAKRERIVGTAEMAHSKKYRVSSSVATSPLHSDMAHGYPPSALSNGVPSTPGYYQGDIAARPFPLATPVRQKIYASPAVPGSASAKWPQGSVSEETPLALIVDAESQSMANSLKAGEGGDNASSSSARVKHDRTMLMSIFTTDDPDHIPEWLSHGSSDVDVNLVIDEQGHTAVHWAAALARINVLDLLLFQGADARQLNYESESALVRAVQVTNNYENQSFPDLLELLHDTIPLTDQSNRTVLHHIAIAAGAEGRDKAVRYYADCLLSWIVRMAGGYQVDGDTSESLPLDSSAGSLDLNAHSGSADSSTMVSSVANGSQPDTEAASKASALLSSSNGHHLPTPNQSSSPNRRQNGFSKSVFDEAPSQSALLNGTNEQSRIASRAESPSAPEKSAQQNTNADFAAFLNLQDVDGNTALNIAARNGDRAMIRMLLGAGASATIANRVGLCPLDFGVDRIAEDIIDVGGEVPLSGSALGSLDPMNSPTPAGLVFAEKQLRSSAGSLATLQTPKRRLMQGLTEAALLSTPAEQRMRQSVLSIQQMMTDLEADFSGEMRLKQEHFEGIKQQLRTTTIELAKARETIHQLHTKTTQLTEIKARVGYLEETLARETCAVREAISSLPADSKPRHDLETLLGTLLSSPSVCPVDADEDVEAGLPSLFLELPNVDDKSLEGLEDDPEKLKAAVEHLRVINQVYARRDALLRERVAALRRRADVSERERQYRQIIASCCEISEADVDIWIDRLVSAVESTVPEVRTENELPLTAARGHDQESQHVSTSLSRPGITNVSAGSSLSTHPQTAS
ncbi:transcriptional regulator swi6 [Coemansia asiatica]|uniref:Transcriptional regulator swi6 n=1 Tax=Coemansia asiatica TaxID=1052880 RepID=A0A9W8CGX4_9FUNG|nr:transcriptional regulator swi6 [Coemansia asiatica]